MKVKSLKKPQMEQNDSISWIGVAFDDDVSTQDCTAEIIKNCLIVSEKVYFDPGALLPSSVEQKISRQQRHDLCF
jgi:hypothetical protein